MRSSQIVEKYYRALADGDHDTVCDLVDEDFVNIYPQSGEVIRGRETYRQMALANPAVPKGEFTLIHHDDKAIHIPSALPGGRAVLVTGSGGTYVAEGLVRYPDGELYNVVSVITLRGGKVLEDRTYFAEPFDPPDWRAPFREAP